MAEQTSSRLVTLTIPEAEQLVSGALRAAGASARAADCTARALVDAQAQGLDSHGLSRVPQYAGFLKNGRAVGTAEPAIINERAASVLVDAGNGLAFTACELAVTTAIRKAARAGACIAAVTNSHHFGVAADHLRPVCDAGMIGLAMGNSPAAMPVPGGSKALLGTNPLAACFPRQGHPGVVIDLSLSEVARGRIMVAAREGNSIPAGWALDASGQPTTDAKAALAGSMLPLGSGSGSAKGGMIVLLIALLVTSLTGASFGAEADSFFEADGNQPRLAQCFVVIDPSGFAGRETSAQRIEALVVAMLSEETVRLPGARRSALRDQATAHGISVSEALVEQIRALSADRAA